jgi:hypothetical protein
MPWLVYHQLHRERVVIGKIFQALPNFCTHTYTTMFALIYKLHKERAMIGRIFQALPTQIDPTVVLYIYTIDTFWMFIFVSMFIYIYMEVGYLKI